MARVKMLQQAGVQPLAGDGQCRPFKETGA
jgi:hypothetical protein